MRRLRDVPKRSSVWITAVLIVVLLGWQLWNTTAAPGRLSPALSQAVDQGETRLSVRVEVDFRLEAFHLTYFQQFGSIVGVQDSELQIRRVDAADVRALARNYWIKKISLTEEISR